MTDEAQVIHIVRVDVVDQIIPINNHRERITAAYLLAFSRPPTAAEITRAENYLKTQTAERGSSAETGLSNLCQALFASAEFRYVK